MASVTTSPITPMQVPKNGTCCICFRPVYAMEAVIADTKFYHKGCFRCATCNRTLSVVNYATHNGWIYCTAHMPKPTTPVTHSRSPSDEPSSPTTPRTPFDTSYHSAWNLTPTSHSHQQQRQHGGHPVRPSPMGRMISSSESDLYRSNSERIRTELTRETQSTTSHPARKEPLYIATSRDSKSPAVSVSERVRAFSAEPPRTHERSQSMRSSSSASSDQIRRIQTDVRKDIQGPYSALETVPPSPPIAGVLGDVLSFETTRQNKSLRKGPLSGAQRPPAANGLRVQTGPVHRRTLSADQSSDLQVFARSPSSGSEYRTPLDTATSNDSLLSSNPSGSERSSSESVHDASRANDVRPVWKHKWMSEPGVQLTEQERLRVLRNVPESGVSSGDSSIQSLIRLNVNALSVMDLSAGDNGALDHSERVSRSLDTMTGKKPLIKGSSPTTTPLDSSSVSSTNSISVLAELAHVVATQGSDLTKIYENFGRLRVRRSVGGTASRDANTVSRKTQKQIATTVFRGILESVRKIMEIAGALVNVKDLRQAVVVLTTKEREAEKEIAAKGICEIVDELSDAIKTTVDTAYSVVAQYTSAQKKLLIVPAEGYRLESIGYDNDITSLPSTSQTTAGSAYASYQLEHIDDVEYYRKNFCGNEHRTYIGDLPKLGPIIISLMYKPSGPRAGTAARGGNEDAEYWAIMRTKDALDLRAVIQASHVSGSGAFRGKSEAKTILSMLNRDIQPSKLRKVVDASIEKRLMVLDELQHVRKYKFGVLYCKGGQHTEEEFFGNETGSPAFERFLSCVGEKVELQGWSGYAAGLDTKNGQTGKQSIFTKWRSFDVMFHVSTYLPFKKGDQQQIQRKRHIGNDIVAIIFVDGEGRFDPKSIKSQFLHVFIAVQEDRTTHPGEIGYRVVIASNVDVPVFGPPLPNPPIFWSRMELRDFLLGKMINAENAAYRAPKFKKPHNRTRNAMIDEILQDYWNSAKNRDRRKADEKSGSVSQRSSVGSTDRQLQQSSTPRTSEATGPSRRPSVFGAIGAFGRRTSNANDSLISPTTDNPRPASLPPLLVSRKNSAAELRQGSDSGTNAIPRPKSVGGSMDGLAEPKKKGLMKLTKQKSISGADGKQKSRSVSALSSTESIGEINGGEGKKNKSNSGILSAFNLKRKPQGDESSKKMSRSMDALDAGNGN